MNNILDSVFIQTEYGHTINDNRLSSVFSALAIEDRPFHLHSFIESLYHLISNKYGHWIRMHELLLNSIILYDKIDEINV